MEVTISTKGIAVDDIFRAYVDRRLRFSLGRFGSHIKRVMVRFADTNGPRGGLDKRCQINVALQPSGSVRIEDFDLDMRPVVDRAAARAASAIERELQRRRDARRL